STTWLVALAHSPGHPLECSSHLALCTACAGCMVAALDLYTQSGDDCGSHVLVDAGHRRPAGSMVAIIKQTENQLSTIYSSSPLLKAFATKVGGGDVATNATILSAIFSMLPLLLMAFAVTQASRWSADE